VSWHYYHFATLYLRTRRYEEAKESMEYFLNASGFMVNTERRVRDLAEMVRLCLYTDDAPAAEEYLRQAEATAAHAPSDYAMFPIEWARATLCAHHGDRDGAKASFERALKLSWSSSPGEFHLDYGRFLASIGDAPEARRILLTASEELAKSQGALGRQAREAIERLGLVPGAT